jgi:eukaryotic-like serine/threonine-protein kinase
VDFNSAVIGGYQIIDTVGAGGMGVVYLAQHQLLGRKAALKVLMPSYSHDADVVSRFFGEARAATAIKHPGIIRVYDFGYRDDGTAYIAMEFLDGESLDARLQRLGPLPIAQALRFTGQMASALAAAHDHGIIHRDLKPANVFIVPDPQVPGGERVKLLDFGIAKFAATDDPNSNKTRDGTIIGTPAYMAPEQCRGLSGIDGRADLYSVGCMLFEMLCGRPPFDGGGNGAMAIMSAQLAETPPLPSSLRPNCRPELDALILCLLAKQPAHRYQSAVALGAALAAVSGEQVSFSWQPSHTDEHGAGGSSGVGMAPTAPNGQPLHPSQTGNAERDAATTHLDAPTQRTRPPRRSRAGLALLGLVGIGAGAMALATFMSSTDQVAPAAAPKVEAPADPAPPAPQAAPPRRPRKPALTFQQLRDDSSTSPRRADQAAVVAGADQLTAAPLAAVGWPSFEFSLSSLFFSGDLFGDFLQAVRLLVVPPRIVTWRLTSSPPGAQVFDGETLIGTTATPLLVTFEESPEYAADLLLRLDGHDDARVKLTGSVDYDETITLVPKISIAIESRPAGAAIVDSAGTQLGVTPATVSLSRGAEAVPLTLQLEGHDDLPVQVVPDRAHKERFALVKKRALISMRIESSPPGASVVKGGVVVGTTPFDDQFLEDKGKVEYTLRLDGHREYRVRLPANRSANKVVTLKPQRPKKVACPPRQRAPGGQPTLYDPYDPCRG